MQVTSEHGGQDHFLSSQLYTKAQLVDALHDMRLLLGRIDNVN